MVFDGKVYVALASHCDHPCVRGRMLCLSATDGGVLWNFYTAPEGSAGAGTWSSVAVDESRRLVYAATGNFCSGDDPYGDSIVALNADTGALVWFYENINRDSENLDFGASPALFDVNGVPALAAGSKDGHCYAVNRVTGQLLWNTRVTDGSAVGGIISSPAAANGRIFMGASVGGNQSGKVVALDQRDGRVLWESPQPRPVIGAPAVADGVLFIGGADGGLRAYDPATGEVLWRADIAPMLGGVSITRERVLVGSIDHNVHVFRLNLSQNEPPRASIRASVTSGRPPLVVDFTAIASDPDGQVVSYAWDFGDGATSSEQSPSHTFETAGSFTVRLRVVDNAGATGGDAVVIGVGDGGGATPQSIVWKNVVGCSVSGGNLVKTTVSAWGNAGASSEQIIESGAGYVQFTASETNRERMFGLSNSDPDQGYASIAFAIHLNTGRAFYVSESGGSRGYFGDYSSGDVFRIAVGGGVVRYSRNGQVFNTSGFAPRYPLVADASLNGEGATITNAVISIGSQGTGGTPAVQVLAPNGGEKLKAEGSASTYTIKWAATGSRLERYDVYLSVDDGATWQEIALGIPAPSSTHAWTVPNLKAKKARIRVVVHSADGQSAEDTSDSSFAIKKSKS